MYRSGKDFAYCPVQEKQDSKFMLNEAPLPTLEFSGSINVRTFFIQGNQKSSPERRAFLIAFIRTY